MTFDSLNLHGDWFGVIIESFSFWGSLSSKKEIESALWNKTNHLKCLRVDRHYKKVIKNIKDSWQLLDDKERVAQLYTQRTSVLKVAGLIPTSFIVYCSDWKIVVTRYSTDFVETNVCQCTPWKQQTDSLKVQC